MIDFRYHLVSIVAVFLALAVGIVVGSTALNNVIERGIAASNASLRQELDQKRTQIGSLQGQLNGPNGAQAFAQAAQQRLVGGLLDGQRVVLVQAPGASSPVTTGVESALTAAGASVTGQVQIQAKFFDAGSSTQNDLAALTQQLRPAGTTLRPGGPQAQAGQLLASAILTQDQPGQSLPGQQGSSAAGILQGFAAGGFLSTSGQPGAHATLAVVIIPATPPSVSDSNAASEALVTLCQQLNLADLGTVVAGSVSGSGPGSAIDVMRADGRTGHLISVDNADTAIGDIVVTQALQQKLALGKSGSYGSLSDASAAGPSPAPSPSPTTSSVASAASKRARSSVKPAATGQR